MVNADTQSFINDLKGAFTDKLELPIVFWYTDTPAANTQKVGGCFFRDLPAMRHGETISLNGSNIGCNGGKFYTGFSPMPQFVPDFVSLKEKYKATPDMVRKFIADSNVQQAPHSWLNFSRLDNAGLLPQMEGLLFIGNPDILSGLTTWAWYDNNSDSAVITKFGSGCSSIVTNAVTQNKLGGRSVFLGFFDPSARPYIGENELSFVIPRNRFVEMRYTLSESCLTETPAWTKIRERIYKQRSQ